MRRFIITYSTYLSPTQYSVAAKLGKLSVSTAGSTAAFTNGTTPVTDAATSLMLLGRQGTLDAYCAQCKSEHSTSNHSTFIRGSNGVTVTHTNTVHASGTNHQLQVLRKWWEPQHWQHLHLICKWLMGETGRPAGYCGYCSQVGSAIQTGWRPRTPTPCILSTPH